MIGERTLLFIIVPIVIVVIIVVVVVLVVVNVIRVRRAGHNPVTLQSDIATRILDSDVLRAAPTKADQLRELDELRASGQITDTEREAARARILGGDAR